MNDPYMLLSYVNTKLRDEFNNLEDLCKSLNLDLEELKSILEKIDYHYDKELNKFI